MIVKYELIISLLFFFSLFKFSPILSKMVDVLYDQRIQQISKSLSSLQPPLRVALEKARRIFSSDNMFQSYNSHLRAYSPCVPWLEYHQLSLKNVDLEIKNHVGNLINFEKFMKLYHEIQDLKQYQMAYDSLPNSDTFESHFLKMKMPHRSRVGEWLQIIAQQKEEENIMGEFLDRNTKMKALLAKLQAEIQSYETEPEQETVEESPVEEADTPKKEVDTVVPPMKGSRIMKSKVSKHLLMQLEESQNILRMIEECLRKENGEEELQNKIVLLKGKFDMRTSLLKRSIDEGVASIERCEAELRVLEEK
jgi:hypothetical protein